MAEQLKAYHNDYNGETVYTGWEVLEDEDHNNTVVSSKWMELAARGDVEMTANERAERENAKLDQLPTWAEVHGEYNGSYGA